MSDVGETSQLSARDRLAKREEEIAAKAEAKFPTTFPETEEFRVSVEAAKAKAAGKFDLAMALKKFFIGRNKSDS